MLKICTLEEMGAHMRDDGIGIYPTETFMALGCRAGSRAAVDRLYAAKRRPQGLPLPLVAANRRQVERIAGIPSEAEKLIELFWPGPLSILLPCSRETPAELSGWSGHVAIRISSHPGARDLALAVGEAIAASSANISGFPPARDIGNLDAALLERVPALWNAPPLPAGGLPSTLIQISAKGRIQILRCGAVPASALQQAGFVVEPL